MTIEHKFSRATGRDFRRSVTLTRLIPAFAIILAAALHFISPARAANLEAALDATLVVYTDDMDEAFLGSAFLWGDGHFAVTNHHVIGNAQTVELRDRYGHRISAQVIARDEGRDIALIAVPGAMFGPGLTPVDTPPAVGTEVYAIGAPLGTEFTVTRGMVSARDRQIEEASPVLYIQHDAAVNPGSSGGPLVDAEGRLVGMNSQIADGSRLFVGIGYAMSTPDMERLVPKMIRGELLPVPKLGLRLREISRKIAVAMGLTEGEGLLVDFVAEGSLAEKAGIQPGDVILAFGDRPLKASGDLAFRIEERKDDAPVVTVLRDGAKLELVLDLSPTGDVLAKLSGLAPVRVGSYSLAGLGIGIDAGTVTGLNPGSPAAFAGLAEGDEILAVDGVKVDELDLAALSFTKPLVLLVRRGEQTLHVVIDPWSKGKGRAVGGANVLDPDVVLF